jgi:hypothetical protein
VSPREAPGGAGTGMAVEEQVNARLRELGAAIRGLADPPEPAVPVAAQRELLGEWQHYRRQMLRIGHRHRHGRHHGIAGALTTCTDGLNDLIARHTPTEGAL